jgi:hypothetical protein
LLLVVEEKNVPRTVRVVTPVALWAMALFAIPHDIDTQGDRILSCSGEHHQQIVFVETTEKAFLSQAHVV